MPIEIEYADAPAGNALKDFNGCCEVADEAQMQALFRLLYDFVEEQLATKTPKALVKFHKSREPSWRVEQGCGVYKTPDSPRLAYALIQRDNVPTILVLGFCLDYPGSEASWWTDVIRPRLIHHI